VEPPGHLKRILVHFPEITLKGRNREEFERALASNIRHRLRRLGLDWPLKRARGRFWIEPPPAAGTEIDEVLRALAEMSGVAAFAAATWLRPADGLPDPERIEAVVVALAGESYQADARFAVRVHRVDKRFPLTSQALERRLGDAIRARTPWRRVDLSHPDCTFRVDIHADGVYLYADRLHGPGGLPVGTGGRVLALLSGGIDSPVAAWLLAKRGCDVDFFHMSAAHPRIEGLDREVVAQLARQLSRYTLRSKLYVAPYTHFDLALRGEASGYGLMLFRRFMSRVAERLAQRIGAQALIVGDSLGQVASQTLENLVANSGAVSMPLLRPLIGFNKQEIIDAARRIGTYEISIQPYKDCCALLSRRPRTRSSDALLADLEARLLPEYDALIDRTLGDVVEIAFDCGELGAGVRLAESGAA
jgi:thiamine biosynthesis protein ThiI